MKKIKKYIFILICLFFTAEYPYIFIEDNKIILEDSFICFDSLISYTGESKFVVSPPYDNYLYFISVVSGNTLVVDWGDGKTSTVGGNATTIISNLYTSTGIYTQKIWGVASYLRFFGSNALVQLDGCITNIRKIDSIWRTFMGCTAITSIPSGCFQNIPLVKNAGALFYGCTKLSDIPDDLFHSLTNVTTFGDAFIGTAISKIPDNLFASNPAVYSFRGTFELCGCITSIPYGLFRTTTNVRTFYKTFAGMTNLQYIPEDIFNYNNIHNPDMGLTFSGCYSITNIPENLFSNLHSASTFWGVFSGCRSLQNIPPDLFKYNTNIVSTDYWDYGISMVFKGCYSITNIPENLFNTCTKTKIFDQIFCDCCSLTTIPENLFASNTQATSFREAFYGCTSLTYIPSILFDANTNVVNFNSTFRYCTAVTGSVPPLWLRTNLVGYAIVTNFTKCFGNMNSNKIDNWNDIPNDWK